MHEWISNLRRILDQISAEIPLIDKTDLVSLTKIYSLIESIALLDSVPSAYVTIAARSAALTQNIIMGETNFEKGCKKLGEVISKLVKEIDRYIPSENENPKNANIPDEQPKNQYPVEKKVIEKAETSADFKDFIGRFVANLVPALEDFEALILEYEKGNLESPGQIKRMLHTWKGEFGALNMQEYSKLVHRVEDQLEEKKITTENLLKLKDFFQTRSTDFLNGVCPIISKSDWKLICNEEKETDGKKDSSSSSNDDFPINKPKKVDITGDPSMMGDFIAESKDHLQNAENLLLSLESDPTNGDLINNIFRIWHTIKGISGFLGLKEIGNLSHAIEGLIDGARKHETVLNPNSIDLLFEANDCLKEMVSSIETAMLRDSSYEVPLSFEKVMKRIENPETIQLPQEIKPADKKIGEILVDNGTVTPEILDQTLESQALGDGRRIGQILMDDNDISAREIGKALGSQNLARRMKSVEETIRVPINRIDQLIDTIGEAAIAQSMIYAHPAIASLNDQSIHTKISHGNLIIRQIQEMAMALRMVSVKSTFQKMARLARDLGHKLNHDVNFVMEGEDTELDKSVVENIGDPLIHMIRNSLDHGIESAEERIKIGKPAKATLKLRAYHRAGNVYIEVHDDGRGLNKDAILQKAISKGMCKSTDYLTDHEIYQFIFEPGFSTAKQVTDVSGRGVGMDVVRRNIESLRGSVDIATTPGEGTVFSIRLPLTLAVIDGMIIRAGKESYLVPTLAIIESLTPTVDQITKVLEKGQMIKVREELIPLVHLESLLCKEIVQKDQNEFTGVVMIVEDILGKRIGLHIDEILGQQQVVIKSLGHGLGDIPGVTGGAIMSDGTVSLILDIGGIIKLATDK